MLYKSAYETEGFAKFSVPEELINLMWFADVYNPVQAGSIDGTDQTPHDAAVHRATFAHCKSKRSRFSFGLCQPLSIPDEPPKHLSTDARKTIFVGRLNYETTEGNC